MNKNNLEETKKSNQSEVTNGLSNDVLNGALTNINRDTSDAISEETIKLKAFLANTKRF